MPDEAVIVVFLWHFAFRLWTIRKWCENESLPCEIPHSSVFVFYTHGFTIVFCILCFGQAWVPKNVHNTRYRIAWYRVNEKPEPYRGTDSTTEIFFTSIVKGTNPTQPGFVTQTQMFPTSPNTIQPKMIKTIISNITKSAVCGGQADLLVLFSFSS